MSIEKSADEILAETPCDMRPDCEYECDSLRECLQEAMKFLEESASHSLDGNKLHVPEKQWDKWSNALEEGVK